MAFEYTPLTAQNAQRQRDQYQAFQSRQVPNAGGSAANPNAMQLAKAMKGLGAVYKGLRGAGAAGTATTGGTGYGLGNQLVSGEAGNATYAGSSGAASGAGSGAVAGGTEAGSTGATGSGGFGQAMGYAGMAKDTYGIMQGMQTPQGQEGRDQGSLAGSAAAAGTGAAQGFAAGGPIGGIVGAALGNESYQWQHGNRAMMTSPKGILQSELTGGLAARDVGRWTGLWE
nr:hypothetical protein [uncultured Pseudomonas sp.]